MFLLILTFPLQFLRLVARVLKWELCGEINGEKADGPKFQQLTDNSSK